MSPPILSRRRPFNVIVHPKSFVVSAVDDSLFLKIPLDHHSLYSKKTLCIYSCVKM